MLGITPSRVNSHIRFSQVALKQLRQPDERLFPPVSSPAAMPAGNTSFRNGWLLGRVGLIFGRRKAYESFMRFKELQSKPEDTLQDGEKAHLLNWNRVTEQLSEEGHLTTQEVIDQLSSLFDSLARLSDGQVVISKSLSTEPPPCINIVVPMLERDRHIIPTLSETYLQVKPERKGLLRPATPNGASSTSNSVKPVIPTISKAHPPASPKRSVVDELPGDPLDKIFSRPVRIKRTKITGSDAETTLIHQSGGQNGTLLRIPPGDSALVASIQPEVYADSEQNITIIPPGVLFGDIYALTDTSAPSHPVYPESSAMCIADGNVQRASIATLRRQIKDDPKVALATLRGIAAYIGLLQDQLQVATLVGAPSRIMLAYGLWLRRYPESSARNPFNPLHKPLLPQFKLGDYFSLSREQLCFAQVRIKESIKQKPGFLSSCLLSFFPGNDAGANINPMPEEGYKIGATIYDSGACANRMLTVKQGAVLVRHMDSKGHYRGMAVLTAGQSFGDMRWGDRRLPLVDEESVIALLPGTKVTIQKVEDAINTLHDDPEARLKAVSTMLNFMGELQAQLSLASQKVLMTDHISIALSSLARKINMQNMAKQCFLIPINNQAIIGQIAFCDREYISRYFSKRANVPDQPQFDKGKHAIAVPFAFVDRVLGTDYARRN